jgi:hypothetical protein
VQLTAQRLALLLCAGLLSSLARAEEPAWKLSTDSAVYTDTDNVLIVTSQLGVAHALDEDGGEASATTVVDVVSAASVDVVAQASKRFNEVRWEANLGISKAFKDVLPSIDYRFSSEADYLSHGFGAGLQARLAGADTVGFAHYGLMLDTIGRSQTPYSTFSRSLTTHSADLGVTQNLSTRALLRLVYSLTLQNGYMEKVYRFVPLFDAAGLARARQDGATLNLDTFNAYRLASRPPEEVPDTRARHALALRGLFYLAAIEGSLRADYRFYVDDWSMLAHTAELSLYFPLSRLFMLDVFARGYTQSAASFYKRVYEVNAADEVPGYRTVDRKLSPFYAVTPGIRIELHAEPFSTYFELSATYTRFTDFLYLDHEIALIGQGGLAWTP